MINLTPLSASASSSSSSEPLCYLLELDEARILLDLGQRDFRASAIRGDWSYEEKVRELAPTISLVLLSHSPTTYLSLYPYARARWGLTCPVYATQPTVEMGRVVCLAEVLSWRSEHAIEDSSAASSGGMNGESESELRTNGKGKEPLRGPFIPTVEEIHEAFDSINATRYNQPLHLGGELSHLLLTPFPSGHTLGGTLFKLRSPTSGTVLYAVGINHTSERHLDGMVGGQGGASGYSEGVTRPDLLIIEGGRADIVNAKRRDRESAFLDLITSTLQSNHSVLIPSDPSPRLMETLVLLDQHWSFKLQPLPGQSRPPNQLWPYPLCVVSRTAQDMLAFARSLIEWMGGVLRDSGGEDVLEGGRKGRRRGKKTNGAMGSDYGVLDFRHIQFYSSPTELMHAHPLMRPKVVLAIPPTLSHGPSRWLFTAMAGTEGNVVLLTSRGEENTLARDIYNIWAAGQDATALWGRGRVGHLQDLIGNMQLEMDTKVPLSGAELEAHLEAEREQKEKEAAHQAALARSRRMLEADDLDTDSESGSDDDEFGGTEGMLITRPTEAETEDKMQMSFDIFVKGQQMRVGRGNQAGEMTRFRMFPHLEKKGRKVDAFGEGIDVGSWIRRGKEIEEEGETQEVRDAKKRKIEEEEKKKEPPEPPSKFVNEIVTVSLHASVFFVDMDGLHDGQAIKTIIGDLQPRKIILVRSSKETTFDLIKSLGSTKATKDIFAPSTGEQVVVGEQVASFSVMLGDSISSTLGSKWSRYEDYEVAVIDGNIIFATGSTVPTLEASFVPVPPVVKEVKVETDTITNEPAAATDGDGEMATVKLEPEPAPEEAADMEAIQTSSKASLPLLTVPSSIFVGDLRLAILKSRLGSLAPPIPAEFAGEGVLICGPGVLQGDAAKAGSIVAVRKLSEGNIVLEGGIGRTYDDVKKELYRGFAQVVAA
ncbi:putative cleavage and polyadenylation specificity factor subunit [Kockovaella imperatae]|uniref:Cleavage and polyadenylation specificity factor subunit 2 n=1 Tax=Kockovaella imperatae TaxID=4999 RepID=A0A1Y1UQD5_9TREE|nr:putative cleavage and polyadenylation specificity factor subunit [Kockovaella imperatae]ORX40182.1 putative cleavage and polyadenylation specificity factor subunit [Kockovaella imperatae]